MPKLFDDRPSSGDKIPRNTEDDAARRVMLEYFEKYDFNSTHVIPSHQADYFLWWMREHGFKFVPVS